MFKLYVLNLRRVPHFWLCLLETQVHRINFSLLKFPLEEICVQQNCSGKSQDSEFLRQDGKVLFSKHTKLFFLLKDIYLNVQSVQKRLSTKYI